MNVMESRLYKTRRLFMLLIGQWPYNNKSFITSAIRFLFSVSMGSIVNVQIFKFFTTEWSGSLCIEIIPTCLLFVIVATKYVMFWSKSNLVKHIFDHINHDWNILSEIDEINILLKSTEEANFIGLVLAWFSYSGLGCVIIGQFVPVILDNIVPLNESRPNRHIFVAEYFVDSKKYFYPIMIHMLISALMSITIIISTDSMSIAMLLHARGIFNIIGYRLEHLFDLNTHRSQNEEIQLVFFKRILRVVKSHKKVIEYVDTMRTLMISTSFIQMIILVFTITGLLLQLNHAITPIKDINIVILNLYRLLGVFLVAFFNMLPGQMLLDCSTDLLRRAYFGNWYIAPIKMQKLLLFIMGRTMEPCAISASKVLCMGFLLYSWIVQTAFSYFTAIYSVQDKTIQ